MSSFEWMELQTLTNDIDMSRSRLVEARRSGDQGRVGALEEEISRAEKRRMQLLAHISTNIVTAPEPRAKAKEGAGSRQASEAVAEAPEEAAKLEQPPAESAQASGSAQRARAREGAGTRQAAAPAGEPLNIAADPPPRDTAGAIEPMPPPKTREGTGSRPVLVASAEASEAAVTAKRPPSEPASAPEPAPPKARNDAVSLQASAAPAEALREAAAVKQPETPSAPEPAPVPKPRESMAPRQAPAPAPEALARGVSGEPQLPDRIDRAAASGVDSPVTKSKADSVEGGTTVWDQLTPGDIERVKNELGVRRAEMLARHAEELKGLDVEQSQIETLEQAIEMFLRKAKRPESAAA